VGLNCGGTGSSGGGGLCAATVVVVGSRYQDGMSRSFRANQ
jgi:hypothetical protein